MTELPLNHGLFGQLRADAAAEWHDYTNHPFVLALGAGTLPAPKFQNFLIQDYLFLIQYARAYALAAYKLDDRDDMRAALDTAALLLDTEMPLHIKYCAAWGITEREMAAAPESLEVLAYTRYVLERGHAGDALDLMVALAPCIVGYAEIGAALAANPSPGNPYQAWIDAYTGPDYVESVKTAIHTLDRLGASSGAPARYPSLLKTFKTATSLEAAFWNTGWRVEQGE
jgi:thiaminase/transcriptional activator TenA